MSLKHENALLKAMSEISARQLAKEFWPKHVPITKPPSNKSYNKPSCDTAKRIIQAIKALQFIKNDTPIHRMPTKSGILRLASTDEDTLRKHLDRLRFEGLVEQYDTGPIHFYIWVADDQQEREYLSTLRQIS